MEKPIFVQGAVVCLRGSTWPRMVISEVYPAEPGVIPLPDGRRVVTSTEEVDVYWSDVNGGLRHTIVPTSILQHASE